MGDDDEFGKMPPRLRLGIAMAFFPDATINFLAGNDNYRQTSEKKLARMVLGRDPVMADDVNYDGLGRIMEIGGKKVEGYTPGLMPVKIGGKRIEYGPFDTPIKLL